MAENEESTTPQVGDPARERGREDERLLAELARARERDDRAGEREAIAKLVGSYDDYISRFVAWRVFDPNDREDVVQGVMLRLVGTLQRRSAFEVPFFAVVRRSAHNEVVDYLRRRDRRLEDASDALPERAAHWSSDPAERIDAVSDTRLEEALAQLPQLDRDLLGAKILIGFSGAEIAEQFGLSESNVNVRVHRALRRLLRILRPDVSDQQDKAD